MKSATVSSLLILLLNILSGCSPQCSPFQYQLGAKCCLKCPPGQRVRTYCTQSERKSCTDCEEGTFMDQSNGLPHCFRCHTCNADSGLVVKIQCTATSDTVCEPLEGFFCVDFSEGKCAAAQKHSRCQPGQYIRENGSQSQDTMCSNCSDGTFSAGTSSSCQTHTQCEALDLVLVKAGSSSADAECGPPGRGHLGLIAGVAVLLIVIVVLPAGGLVSYRLYRKRRKKISNTQL